MQLEFRCPECRVSGLTPEIREDKAIAVALKQLRIRCPACSAIVEVTEPLGRVLWKTQERVAGVLVETAERSLSSLIREALKAEIAGQEAKKDKKQDQGQIGWPGGLLPPAPTPPDMRVRVRRFLAVLAD
jgi:hypothetical protein